MEPHGGGAVSGTVTSFSSGEQNPLAGGVLGQGSQRAGSREAGALQHDRGQTAILLSQDMKN